jgi:hypothetical protein
MSLTATARNQALDGILIDQMSLHSDFPGTTGSNELSGGGYTRLSATFNSASGGVRNLSAPAVFTVGAGHTVRWVGLWGGGVFKAYSPNAGSPREFQVDIAANTVSVPAHGYVDGDLVVFYGGTIPGGVAEGSPVFVINAATDTFKVSLTSGGAEIDLTTAGAPDCVVSRVIANAYGGADTHTVNTYGLGAVF